MTNIHPNVPVIFFKERLAQDFDKATTKKIIKVLKELQLPLPNTQAEFMPGTTGEIIFSNRYGVVIRIEHKNGFGDFGQKHKILRINDSQWILQPLASFNAGKAVIEICPGSHFETSKKKRDFIKTVLKKEGINFWDSGIRNVGRLPIKTPRFPQGLPVVIDRLAVEKLDESVHTIKNSLQADFYRPLKNKIAAACKDKTFNPIKIRQFWDLCEEFVQQGKLIAGWNNYQPLYDNWWENKEPQGPKGQQAIEKAKAYDALFNKPQKKIKCAPPQHKSP